MGTQLEGFIAMMVVALIGGGVAFGVFYSDSVVLHATFAYVGTHLLFAMLFLMMASAVMVAWSKDKQEPKHPLVLSALIVVVLPAVCSGIMLWRVLLPALNEPLGSIIVWTGAMATPFLVLGIGGSIMESVLARSSNGANKHMDNSG